MPFSIRYWQENRHTTDFSGQAADIAGGKRKQELLGMLRQFDDTVSDIGIEHGSVFFYIFPGIRVPFRYEGHGYGKILLLLSAVMSMTHGILLIDEFENGLDRTSQDKLWRILFDLCMKQDVQLFAATHSWECIASFIGQGAAAGIQNRQQVYRIERNQDGSHRIVEISAETAGTALENNLELR
jgi:hypothetical protein